MAASPRQGVLIAQIGSPEAPTASATREYLRQFLSDPFVIDYPAWFWKPILNGFILPFRSVASAKKYAQIWTGEGAPIVAHTQKLSAILQESLRDVAFVEHAFFYRGPGVLEGVKKLLSLGGTDICLFPLFPQPSFPTNDGMEAEFRRGTLSLGLDPSRISIIRGCWEKEGYINTLAATYQKLITNPEESFHLLFSFHGLPVRYPKTADYVYACKETARRVALRMGLPAEKWSVAFQSHFGPERWLSPSTEDVLQKKAKEKQALYVAAPGFVSDCIETLHELGIEGKETFVSFGGNPEHYRYLPCLNEERSWTDFLGSFLRASLESSSKV